MAFDVGTPERLLAANLVAGHGGTFVHPTARAEATLRSSVVLPGAEVVGQDELAFCVCGPGGVRVQCDADQVRREMELGAGVRHGGAPGV